MLPHEEDMDGLKEYLMELERVGSNCNYCGISNHYDVQKICTKTGSACEYTALFYQFSCGKLLEKQRNGSCCAFHREATLEEIKQSAKNSDVPLEVFLHGAMCISFIQDVVF